ncbi:MAG: hypothetical protein ABWY20_12505 [Mycobacterium sp.]
MIRWDDVFTTVVSGALIALVGAFVAIFITQRVGEYRQRRLADRDRRVAALAEFFTVYGGFFACWKAWDSGVDDLEGNGSQQHLSEPKALRTASLLKAAAVEGELETFLLRVTAEYRLDDQRKAVLWALRVSFKSLRYAIEDGRRLKWRRNNKHTDGGVGLRSYAAFKALATFMTAFLLEDHGGDEKWLAAFSAIFRTHRSDFPSVEERLLALQQVTGQGTEFTSAPAISNAISEEIRRWEQRTGKPDRHEVMRIRALVVSEAIVGKAARASTNTSDSTTDRGNQTSLDEGNNRAVPGQGT